MSSPEEKIIRSYVGELPLIKHVADNLGIKPIFSKHISSHGNEKIPSVDSLMMLLYNITCGRQPLYELEEWVMGIEPEIFGYAALRKDIVNDDRFGKALDKLYHADRATMMTEIVISMTKRASLDLSRIHNDSTTVKAYGRIPGTTRSGLKLDYGFSKEHRPDLKQLVYTLTICADGAVPVHYKTYAGNRTDDTTHIETWNTLVSIIGRPCFLYVADSKVCTDKQLKHIAGRGGRVVTIIPETWKETRQFKDSLREKKKSRTVICRRAIPGSKDKFEYFSCYAGDYRTHKNSYRIHWIFSSEKRKRDRQSREDALKKAEQDMAELCGKLNTRNLKTKKNILSSAEQILKTRGVRKFFHISVDSLRETYKIQASPGRPGRKTKFKTRTQTIYSLSYTRNRKTLSLERNADGIFPLLSTDNALSAKDVLLAYKYQPRLEKRFTQLRSVHNASPLLFKRIERIEAVFFLFFLALMIQAVLERQVRHNMKSKNIESLPVYPEHRIAYHPTTAKIFERFEGLSIYRLVKGNQTFLYKDELSEIHREILDVLDISQTEYWPV